jgi:peptidoglycan DL-endopeptidase LytE
MMKRRIFPWMGLIVLFIISGVSQEIFAKEYKVKRGDTLVKIAKKTGVTTDALRNANGLTSDALKLKQVLVIPGKDDAKLARSPKTSSHKPEYYAVVRGDTLQSIAGKTGCSVKEIRQWNHVDSRRMKPGQKLALFNARLKGKSARERIGDDDSAGEMDDAIDEDDEEISEGEDLANADQDEASGSDPLGRWNSAHERSLFIRVAKGFMGAPYRLGGSSVRGLDCSAFVKKIYQFFDVSLPRTAREQSRVGKHIAREDLKEGDLIFFNTKRAFGHVGIYIGNNEFVHAAAGHQRMVKIDTLEKPYYDKRFVKAVRIKELKEEL